MSLCFPDSQFVEARQVFKDLISDNEATYLRPRAMESELPLSNVHVPGVNRGDGSEEGKTMMHTIFAKHAAIFGVAILLGTSAISPTLAASSQSQVVAQQSWQAGPPSASPNTCWSDEGYGRWSDCDRG